MNGPLDGGGLFVASLSNGVFCGIGAANTNPKTLANVPLGAVSAMVMSPVSSLVVMPLIVSALPSARYERINYQIEPKQLDIGSADYRMRAEQLLKHRGEIKAAQSEQAAKTEIDESED
jgi:hypothetical protein